MSITTSRRGFIASMVAAGGVRALAQGGVRRDPALVAFISDLHVNGLKDEVPTHLYEETCLKRVVADILALDPLPANVVCLGDIAYHWGQPEDYPLAASILKPLVDAGIALTLGMGNHDRRGNFLAQWPEYAKSSPVPGRIVSKVALPGLDLIVLDTLNAKEVEKKKPSNPGELDAAQREWLAHALKSATRPVITCSHHRPNEDKVGLTKLLMSSPACKAHIYGHWHKWGRDFLHNGWDPQRVFPVVCMPSTGHWGDIGFATMRVYPDRVTVTNHQTDFFFTGGPGDNASIAPDIVREKNGQSATLRLG